MTRPRKSGRVDEATMDNAIAVAIDAVAAAYGIDPQTVAKACSSDENGGFITRAYERHSATHQ